MGSLGDSNAILEDQRQLAQHQAIITLIQGILQDPLLDTYNWLDLACGKGQLILHLEDNIQDTYRSKIEYIGYDIKEDFIKIAEKTSSTLNLKSCSFEVGDLSNFHNIINSSQKFDCITLINVIHEISPNDLANILFELLIRLKKDGILFIYDMEQINPLELGAVTWNSLHFSDVLSIFFSCMRSKYCPYCAKWTHASRTGWSVQLRSKFFDLDITDFINHRDEVIAEANNCIIKIITDRYNSCKQVLDSLTKYGPSTPIESEDIQKNLYEFWALSRAKEGFEYLSQSGTQALLSSSSAKGEI